MADEVASVDEARNDDPSPGGTGPSPGGTGEAAGGRGRPESAWAVPYQVARALAGGISLVLGLLWVLMNTTEGSAAHPTDIVVGVVLAAGGLVLLMPHRIRLPRLATAVVATTVGVIGTVAGLAVKTAQSCCMYGYVVDRGWPFHWLSRGGQGDDLATAYRMEQAASWDLHVSLLVDLVLWAYAGMLLVVIAVLVRRARRDQDERRPAKG
jgi:hypothetical protein